MKREDSRSALSLPAPAIRAKNLEIKLHTPMHFPNDELCNNETKTKCCSFTASSEVARVCVCVCICTLGVMWPTFQALWRLSFNLRRGAQIKIASMNGIRCTKEMDFQNKIPNGQWSEMNTETERVRCVVLLPCQVHKNLNKVTLKPGLLQSFTSPRFLSSLRSFLPPFLWGWLQRAVSFILFFIVQRFTHGGYV